MSENKVEQSIIKATQVLNSSFGIENIGLGSDFFRYIKKENLVDIYKTEIYENKTERLLSELVPEISKMRSSYLSSDIINAVQGLASSLEEISRTQEETIADGFLTKESYENTFLRMMGMPQSESISFATGSIYYVTYTGDLRKDLSYEEPSPTSGLIGILNERQLRRADRSVLTTGAWNTSEQVFINENLNTEVIDEIIDSASAEVLGTDFSQGEAQNEGIIEQIRFSTNLSNIEDESFAYSYLLLPPVQDSRVSKCINETTKIVPPNFSNSRANVINSDELRTSMLESVIRIRLDRLSGNTNTTLIDGESEVLTADSYGVLESLFIIRLQSAIEAFAEVITEKLENIRIIQEKTNTVPVEDLNDDENNPATKKSPEDTQPTDGSFNNETLYDQILNIEDAIMALLDDNEKVIDLQVNTQRKSSIKNSHIMSSFIGIIDLPRQRALREKVSQRNIKNDFTGGVGDGEVSDVDNIIGITKSVGTIDILVFVLALFTIPESFLLGLLSKTEYQNFLGEFSSSGVDGPFDIGNSDPLLSINTLTEYIVDGYRIFQSALRGGRNIVSENSSSNSSSDIE